MRASADAAALWNEMRPTCDNTNRRYRPYNLGHRRTLADGGGNVNDELFTGDLDVASAQTRDELAALLRAVHLRADRPSLRTLEARTRHETAPLSKTVVSEMLKGTRFPRKAVMSSFLRACGVPEAMMEPWHRAWERAAAGEQDRSGSAASRPSAEQSQLAGAMHITSSVTSGQADALETPVRGDDAPSCATGTSSAELAAEQRQNLADQTAPSRVAHGPITSRRELGMVLRTLRMTAGLTIEQVAERLPAGHGNERVVRDQAEKVGRARHRLNPFPPLIGDALH